MQTKTRSLKESILNVMIGFALAFISTQIIFPMLGARISLLTNMWITLWYTVLSITRSYVVRRMFNKFDS